MFQVANACSCRRNGRTRFQATLHAHCTRSMGERGMNADTQDNLSQSTYLSKQCLGVSRYAV